MSKRFLVVLTIISVLIGGIEMASAQSLEYAKDLHRHNLIDKAKEAFIDILYNAKSTDADKTGSLYWLGQISFEEGNYTVAISDWEKLIEVYPGSPQAKEVNDQILLLKETASKMSQNSIFSVVGTSYIENGDFWADSWAKYNLKDFDKSKFGIEADPGLISTLELAFLWYDKSIKEFPNSDIAEFAYRRKLLILVNTANSYASDYSKNKMDYESYKTLSWQADVAKMCKEQAERALGLYEENISKVLETFTEYEKAFPKGLYTQAFRYQIAQSYRYANDISNERIWLQKIIDVGKGEQTFYIETAKARLEKMGFKIETPDKK